MARRENKSMSAPGTAPPPRPTPGSARALRRLVTGLSIALTLLGFLMILGLLTLEYSGLAWLGGVPLAAGVSGFFAVAWRLPKALRDPQDAEPRAPRRMARWFWAPAVVALAGAGGVAAGMLMPRVHAGEDPTLIRNHVVMWLEIGLVLLILAAVLLGLILLGLWTTPDEDDHTILRRTDYAQRRREGRRPSDAHGPHGPGPDSPYYDPDWIRGRPEDPPRG